MEASVLPPSPQHSGQAGHRSGRGRGSSAGDVTPKPPEHRDSPEFEVDTKTWGAVGWVGLGLAVESRTPSWDKRQPRCAGS